MENGFKHPIRVVSRRTGLSPHVIRAWERRYRAITPQRTRTNRRLYSDEEVRRLQLLRRATLAGHSIGQIAILANEALETMVAQDETYAPTGTRATAGLPGEESPAAVLDSCIGAVFALDPKRLDELLSRALVRFSHPTVVEEILLPFMVHLGEGWQQGRMKAVHEHLASVVVRNVLGALATAYGTPGTSSTMVVTTPAGQVHEFGALAVAASAVAMGWHVIYLGPNLPAEEIAAAMEAHAARVMALSVVHPGDDPRLSQEIQKLRRLVGYDVEILVGGRAAGGYKEAIELARGVVIQDLGMLRSHLESIDRSRAT